MKSMNGSKPDARKLIDRIMASERMQGSSHFSDRVYTNEPILTTGRQMASYLPDRYREMKSISRWEPAENGRGRWLSESELFYRQGIFMADLEDDCPYHGNFASYFPTYNAMSDRQLRGYFTWRTQVRRGNIEETSLSFAYVYLYELLCGIGVAGPRDGFDRLKSFWQAYRTFSPEIDRFARTWLQDYVVYHDLSPQLLEPSKTLTFDRSLMVLVQVDEQVRERLSSPDRPRRKKGVSALPLPADASWEEELFSAIDTLSSYNLAGSRLYKSNPEALRHVCCAVYVRMSEYYLKQRTYGLTESLFGQQLELAYTMFGSAVFFDPVPHPDADFELDGIHRYRCRKGAWTCERFQGGRERNAKLGHAMRTADRLLREALGFPHPLKMKECIPKYLQGFIEEEIRAWTSWQQAHAPRRIDIDLSRLSGIRSAAAVTRESLLIDEEREGAGALLDAADGAVCSDAGFSMEGCEGAGAPLDAAEDAARTDPKTSMEEGKPTLSEAPAKVASTPEPEPPAGAKFTEYLRALLGSDIEGAQNAAAAASLSEDLLVDAINEALFDLVGDTVIEYGATGPELIEDYREDVEGYLNHD